ncbi:MAG: DNA-formamidopyrimidine glycosylase [Acidobacteria bacterium]|nr:DNA-formamidopyrimidine glycosylase [Acidobacteriota bacterium]
MPELPEVETVVRGLRPDLIGQTIRSTEFFWAKTYHQPSAPLEGLLGRTFHKLDRRGKYIVAHLDVGYLWIHLRMTGRLYFSQHLQGEDRWTRAALGLDSRYLIFSDARKFGRIGFCLDLDWLEEKLGPEPLTLDAKIFGRILHRPTAIKALLLDQARIAGVGNIYADESLFAAGVHPLEPANKIKPAKALVLLTHLQAILQRAIQHEGATIGWYRKPDGQKGSSQDHFQVYGKTNQPCPHCGAPIQRILVTQRSTHFCAKCQKKSSTAVS